MLWPSTDLTKISLSHTGFYIQAFHESVTFLAAGYHYDSHWSVLSVGPSPTRMAAILAAPDPDERDYLQPERIDQIMLDERLIEICASINV